MSEYVNVVPETAGKSVYIPGLLLRLTTYELTVPVDAVQLKSIWDDDTGVAVRVGTLGTVVGVVADASFE
jgi:hypothetical protein